MSSSTSSVAATDWAQLGPFFEVNKDNILFYSTKTVAMAKLGNRWLRAEGEGGYDFSAEEAPENDEALFNALQQRWNKAFSRKPAELNLPFSDAAAQAFVESFKLMVLQDELKQMNRACRPGENEKRLIEKSVIVVYKEGNEEKQRVFSKNYEHRKCHACSAWETTLHKVLKCAGCRNVYYCNDACQQDDWENHKPQCRALKG